MKVLAAVPASIPGVARPGAESDVCVFFVFWCNSYFLVSSLLFFFFFFELFSIIFFYRRTRWWCLSWSLVIFRFFTTRRGVETERRVKNIYEIFLIVFFFFSNHSKTIRSAVWSCLLYY